MRIISIYNNDNRLIKRAKKKDRKAQKELYERYSPKMLGVCRQYIKDIQHAEEAMLSGFLKVFTYIDKFEFRGSFEGWIRRIVVNECLAFLKKRKLLQFVEEDQLNTGIVENRVTEDTEEEELQALIDFLPNDMKVVFNLYVIEGYKHAEISDLLSISVNASKLRLSKARKILKERYYETQKVKP